MLYRYPSLPSPLWPQFSPLSQSLAWGEERVFFADPQTQQVRSLPLAWTSLAPLDPFLVVAAGKTVLYFEDIGSLNQMLKALPAQQKEDQ
ncbi:DUF5372 family protein [Ktedonospora formicarum]|uniref:DUF5372 family protein n=1 Tax=Ktedonospora formicarum TaxID=2778364 RepID=UPI003B75C44F